MEISLGEVYFLPIIFQWYWSLVKPKANFLNVITILWKIWRRISDLWNPKTIFNGWSCQAKYRINLFSNNYQFFNLMLFFLMERWSTIEFYNARAHDYRARMTEITQFIQSSKVLRNFNWSTFSQRNTAGRGWLSQVWSRSWKSELLQIWHRIIASGGTRFAISWDQSPFKPEGSYFAPVWWR